MSRRTRKQGHTKRSRTAPSKAMAVMDFDEFLRVGMASETDEEEDKYKRAGKRQMCQEKEPNLKKRGMSHALAGLAQTDPEFFQYLSKNDRDLLTFGESEEEDEPEEEEKEENEIDSEQAVPEPVPKHIGSWKEQAPSDEEMDDADNSDIESCESEEEGGGSGGEGVVVTVGMVQGWVKDVTKSGSLSSLQPLLLALRCAVEGVVGRGGGGGGGGEADEGSLPYQVDGTAEFNAVVGACLCHVTPCLSLLLSPPLAGKRLALPFSHKAWPRVRTFLQPYLLALLRLMAGLREPSMICALLRHVHSLVLYYTALPKANRKLLLMLTRQWATEDQHVQVLAFLTLRQVTILTPHPSLLTTFKKMYLCFVRSCKFSNLHSLLRIRFMKNCLVELLALDQHACYQLAFIYIRQLGLHLRSAVSAGKKDAVQVVQSWQFVHCLDVWCQALSSSLPQQSSLRPLLYPLIETVLGTAGLCPSPRTVPLRLHLFHSLSLLSSSAQVFIPIAPLLLEILEAHCSSLPSSSSSSGRSPVLSCLLKASKSQLQSQSYWVCVLNRTYELLLSLLASHSHCIAFPELAYPTLVRLRKIAKATPISWLRLQVQQLIEKIEEDSVNVCKERAHVSFAPKDTDTVDSWERRRQAAGPHPLLSFLATWKKLHPDQSISDQQNALRFKEKGVMKARGNKLKRRRERREEEDDDEEEEVEEEEEVGKQLVEDNKAEEEKSEMVGEGQEVKWNGDEEDCEDTVQDLCLSSDTD